MVRIDYAAFTTMLSEGESAMAVRDHRQGTEDPLGLMIFHAIDHGVRKRGRSLRTANT
jgi:hypothetical protein